jgi:hypothetical protein
MENPVPATTTATRTDEPALFLLSSLAHCLVHKAKADAGPAATYEARLDALGDLLQDVVPLLLPGVARPLGDLACQLLDAD